jgi:hypothetical protein
MELFILRTISKGGGNPFGSLVSFENSKLEMEFGKARVGNNKLMQRRLSRESYASKHHMLLPCVVWGFIYILEHGYQSNFRC